MTTINLQHRIPGAQLAGNTLRIERIRISDSGRYTCFAQNKAGIAEQDVNVFVMSKFGIIKQKSQTFLFFFFSSASNRTRRRTVNGTSGFTTASNNFLSGLRTSNAHGHLVESRTTIGTNR